MDGRMNRVLSRLIVFQLIVGLNECHSESVLNPSYNRSLFPPPIHHLIGELESKNCYNLCLVNSRRMFDCSPCIWTDEAPPEVTEITFCCFYYQQIVCTFETMIGKLESDLSITLSPNRSEISELELELKQTLVRLQSEEQCSQIELENQCQSAKTEHNITESNPIETNTNFGNSDNEEDISVLSLLAIGCASLLVASLLFAALVFVTNKEKQHFLALRASSYTTEINESH